MQNSNTSLLKPKITALVTEGPKVWNRVKEHKHTQVRADLQRTYLTWLSQNGILNTIHLF